MTIYWLERVLCLSRPEQWIYSLFTGVTDEWTSQGHIPWRSTRSSSLGDLNNSLPFSDMSEVYLYQTKSSVSQDTWTMYVQSLFPGVTYKWPFQDHLLNRNLLTCRAPSWKTSTVTSHLKMSPKYNFTNWKNSVPWDTLTMNIQILFPSVLAEQPAISRWSSKYNPPGLKSSVFQETWTWMMYSLFPSVTNEWPIQNHLPSRALLTKVCCHGRPQQQLCEVSPSNITIKWPAILRHLPSITLPIWRVLYPWRPQHGLCRVSLTNDQFKSIFQE